MLINIIAKFSCDDCGIEFTVPISPPEVSPEGWTAFDIAEDAIRSGIGYEDGLEHKFHTSGSVENNKHLCSRCTKRHDKLPEARVERKWKLYVCE